jgi:hypothetical protein
MEDEPSLDWTPIVAERKIREAMEQGAFDNLPGSGKPLELDEDPLTPPHLRIVHHVMKNARVLPAWIEMEREIDRAKADAEKFLADHAARVARGVAHDPTAARARYHSLLREANDLILKYNLVNPFVHRAPIPFRIKLRMADWDAQFGKNPEQ